MEVEAVVVPHLLVVRVQLTIKVVMVVMDH